MLYKVKEMCLWLHQFARRPELRTLAQFLGTATRFAGRTSTAGQTSASYLIVPDVGLGTYLRYVCPTLLAMIANTSSIIAFRLQSLCDFVHIHAVTTQDVAKGH